jgi:hypothetical protein
VRGEAAAAGNLGVLSGRRGDRDEASRLGLEPLLHYRELDEGQLDALEALAGVEVAEGPGGVDRVHAGRHEGHRPVTLATVEQRLPGIPGGPARRVTAAAGDPRQRLEHDPVGQERRDLGVVVRRRDLDHVHPHDG